MGSHYEMNAILNYTFLAAFIITIYFIINSSFISFFVWKLPNLFQDWAIPIDWLRCNSIGYDIYSSNIKNCTSDLMAYGKIWLLVPYFEKFENYYSCSCKKN